MATLGVINIGALVTGVLAAPRGEAESLLAENGRIAAIGAASRTAAGRADVGAHSYSPRQRSTAAFARCQSYERNMRVFTTGCAAE